MQSFFKQNLAALAPRTPAAASLSPTLSDRVTVLTTASGAVSVRYEKTLIHSSYDPIKEGKAFSRSIRPGSRVFLYGFGLGHHIGPLLERIGPSGSLFVVELNPDLLSAALILKDHSHLFAQENFHLLFGREEIAVAREIATRLGGETPADADSTQILFHTPSFACIPPQFPGLINALEILRMERRFPALMGSLEQKNRIHNEAIAAAAPGINTLKDRHRGRPGILVSAGPSLDDTLPHLARFSPDAVVAAVDTALPILITEGCVPDYVFTLDPQEESCRYFAGHWEQPFRLIFTPTAQTKILHRHAGEKYVVYKEGASETAAEQHVKGTTRAGGSVACLALDGLILMGCNPIFLLGQDLAYSGERSYSSHSRNSIQLADQVHHSLPLGAGYQEKAGEKKQIAVRGAFGETLKTHQNLFSYKRTIEQIAEIHPEVRIFNLRSHGAAIENVGFLGSAGELKLFFPHLSG